MSFFNFIKINVFCLMLVGGSFLTANHNEMHQVITFAVGPMNYFGKIMGPAPAFELKGEGAESETWENTYSVSTNELNKKVVGFLDADMPKGTSLQVTLTPPKGARSMGLQTLSATPVELVIEVSEVSASGLPMVYKFKADSKSGVIPMTSRTITYTVVDG
jgi:hypothetical protein